MGKELAAIIIGIGVEIIVTIFGVVVKTIPMPFAIAGGIIGFGLIVYGLIALIRGGAVKLASGMNDADMGKHLTQIKKMLDTFKRQLMAISNKKGLLGNLGITIEKKRGFYQIWEHCPSMLKTGQDLRLSRVLYEAKLKKHLVTAEDDTHIRERMKALADAIDNCLSDSEYLKHSCSNCIEKRSQLSGISNEGSLVLTPHTYSLGYSSMTGFPDKPDNALWLCLEVAVNPINKPIDTLDLLIDNETIHANRWPGKNVAAFNVYFNVSEWQWKGEKQVELIAKVGNNTYSAGRIPIDFDVEAFGDHRI